MKKILFSALMLAALASCSKNENVGGPENTGAPEIMLSGKALSIETKGAYNETTPTAIAPLKAFVVGTTNPASYMMPYVSGTMTFTSMAVGFDAGNTGIKQYPAAAAPVSLMGFYPAVNAAGIALTASANRVVMDFAGTEDVMFAQPITTTSADVDLNATPKNFEFNHQLTQLEVKVVVDGEQTIANTWGVIKDMSLLGAFNSKATVTMGTTGSIAFSTPVTGWKFYTAVDAEFVNQNLVLPATGQAGTANNVLLATSTLAATTMVAPHTAVAGTPSYKLSIKTGEPGTNTSDIMTNVDVIVKTDATGATDYVGNTKGYKFTILLVFKAKTIHATASVEPWTNGGTTVAPIE